MASESAPSSSAQPEAFATFGPAWTLSAEPPMFLSGVRNNDLMGISRAFGERFGDVDAGFILFPTWSLEREGFPERLRVAFDRHRLQFPRHHIRYICSTAREAELLRSQGLPALFLNQNFTVSEAVFRPLSAIDVEFDAIYNARFIPEKRHELAALVPRVGYVTYIESDQAVPAYQAIYDTTIGSNPNHVLLNPMWEGRPIWMSHERVNAQMARASVGLILSGMEGANYASMEYMLAGLPVVSTPSVGGRDVYFDPDYCLVCEPTPESVRDAVATLKGQKFSREEVRQRTLAKIETPRERFLELIDEVLGELAASPRFGGRRWPFGTSSAVGWAPYADHFARFGAERRKQFGERLGLHAEMLAGVERDAEALEPAVEMGSPTLMVISPG